jgi:hypothetical protein
MSDTVESAQRARMIREIEIRLGGMMIEVELTPDHYNLAIDYAIQRYRQRSATSMEESFVFLETKADVSSYTLPNEVQEVVALYRSSIGHSVGSGAMLDPAALSFAQNMYMMQGFGGGLAGGGGGGTLATYDFAAQNQKVMGKMLGRELLYTWTPSSKRLLLHRKITGEETIMVHVYNQQPEEVLLGDVYARPWLSQYAIAQSKLMLGEARSLYGSLAGPQGGITLNGDALKSEAQVEIEKLDQELKEGVGQRMGYGIHIG